MKKIIFVFMAVMIAASSSAQAEDVQQGQSDASSSEQGEKVSPWKVGLTVGYTNNSYSMSSSYQSDWELSSRGGVTVGVSGQYDILKWLGVRADLQWMQRNYERSRSMISNDYKYTNNYLMLPVMASFSFGGEKVCGFFNAGVYGGYWMSSSASVNGTNYLSDDENVEVSQGGMIYGDRDNRFVFGYIGGAGVEYRFMPHWSAQVEFRYYYDATSQVKQYERIRDHRYNGTIDIHVGVFYRF